MEESRAKEEKDAANRRIVMLESQSSAASGDMMATSSYAAPVDGTEDSNRRVATPSGKKMMSIFPTFFIKLLYFNVY